MRVKKTNYHENGKISSFGYLKDGKRDGYWKWYREDGSKLKLGHFSEGKRTKDWMKYDKKGKLI